MKYFWLTLRWVWRQKFKALIFLTLTLLWVLVLFPMQKVGDLIETLVPKLTGYQSFVFFDRFALSPSGALRLENVWFSTQGLKPIEVSQVLLKPRLLSLFGSIPQGQLIANNLFGGTVQMQLSQSSGNQLAFNLSAAGLQMEPLLETIQAPVQVVGSLNLNFLGQSDPGFQDPQAELNLSSSGLTLKSSQIPTPIGSLTLPQVTLSQGLAKVRLTQGRLIIDPTQLGSPNDDLSVQISGEMALVMRPHGFQMGAYHLDLDLLAKPGFIQRGGFLLSLLEGYKRPDSEGQRYRFRVSALEPGVPPSITAR